MTAGHHFPKTARRPGPSPEPPTVQHDHGSLWDCVTCSLYLEDPPPAPPGGWVTRPDTMPRTWTPKGHLDPSEDPCGRPPTFRRRGA